MDTKILNEPFKKKLEQGNSGMRYHGQKSSSWFRGSDNSAAAALSIQN